MGPDYYELAVQRRSGAFSSSSFVTTSTLLVYTTKTREMLHVRQR